VEAGAVADPLRRRPARFAVYLPHRLASPLNGGSATGPYRLLRHPGYAGGLLATIAIGVMWGNWVSLATLTGLLLVFIVWRIRTEEKALLAALDGRYRAYAAQHKRLVPLVW
jgi:protein-S-isoprenylcysteine O-methyltransferase Ste14